jgi:hypothetical protein
MTDVVEACSSKYNGEIFIELVKANCTVAKLQCCVILLMPLFCFVFLMERLSYLCCECCSVTV